VHAEPILALRIAGHGLVVKCLGVLPVTDRVSRRSTGGESKAEKAGQDASRKTL
jgi:hypothetical protein